MNKAFALLFAGIMSVSAWAQEGISVTGKVTQEVTPDEMVIQFSVNSVDKDVKKAFSLTEEKSSRIVEYIKSLEDICEVQTAHVSLSEKYTYNNSTRVNERVGFIASQSFMVTLKDFDEYPQIMSKLLDLGVERINGVIFQVSNSGEIRNELRARAIAVAKKKAGEIAEALDVKLGSAESYTEGGSAVYQPMYRMAYAANEVMDGVSANGGSSIAPGKQSIEMEVHVRFAILAPEE